MTTHPSPIDSIRAAVAFLASLEPQARELARAAIDNGVADADALAGRRKRRSDAGRPRAAKVGTAAGAATRARERGEGVEPGLFPEPEPVRS